MSTAAARTQTHPLLSASLGLPAKAAATGAAPVAQLDRVLPSEGRGHRFKSCRVRHTTRAADRGLAFTGPLTTPPIGPDALPAMPLS